MRTSQEEKTQKADIERIERTARVLERLAKVLGVKTDTDLAEALHVKKTTLSSWRARGSLPYAECERVADERGVSLDYLLSGKQVLDIYGDMRRQWQAAEEAGEYIGLPVYDVHAAAGGGTVVEKEELSDVLMFKRSWLEAKLHANAKDLSLIYVEGESMEPTLRAGDIILVDRRDIAAQREGIYVLRADNALLVKRLQRLPRHRLKISSDNPAYQPFEIDLKEQADEFAIIGRVVWAGRSM